MTIKEIETLSGLPRANIRYYESEGLIAPKRAENGYREYSQADAEVLLRVKLLRALPGIDTIKSLAAGTLMLGDALDARLEELHAEQENWTPPGASRRTAAGACGFSTLDAAGYLGELLAASQTALRQDEAVCHAPVRRYIARSLIFCVLATVVFMPQAVGVDPKARLTSIWLTYSAWFNACSNRCFCTCSAQRPANGLGLRDGRKWTEAAACRRMRRTWRALWYGYGCFIPVYSIVRLYTSWKAEQAEQPLEWEDGSELRAAPWKAWRGAAWAAAVLALLAATVLVP
ncbi:MAG: MerR family transcriptional regulator [Oscillospiraceae bacterium]